MDRSAALNSYSVLTSIELGIRPLVKVGYK